MTANDTFALVGAPSGFPETVSLREPCLLTVSLKDLTRTYIELISALSQKTTPLRQVIETLLERGVHWRELIRLAKAYSRNDKYVRQIISQILTGLGIRRRKPGAGRETPQRALAILADIRRQDGDDAVRLLGAAYRAGRAEDAERNSALQNSRTQAA